LRVLDSKQFQNAWAATKAINPIKDKTPNSTRRSTPALVGVGIEMEVGTVTEGSPRPVVGAEEIGLVLKLDELGAAGLEAAGFEAEGPDSGGEPLVGAGRGVGVSDAGVDDAANP